jgi:copper chaperone CopZ
MGDSSRTDTLTASGATCDQAKKRHRLSSSSLTTTTLTLPEISSQTCKAAIEGIVAAIAGVATVDVDVPAKTVTSTTTIKPCDFKSRI